MKKLLIALAGAVVGSLVFFIVGYISNALDPTPTELMDPETAEEVVRRVQSTPVTKWIYTIVGLGLGTLSGCCLASRWSGKTAARGVAVLMSLWPAYTFYVVYPDVLWVPLSMILLIVSSLKATT